MPAILNLRLAPTAALDAPPPPTSSPGVTPAESLPLFTDLLQSRVDSVLTVERPGGEFLPEHGNALPLAVPNEPTALPLDVPTTIELPDHTGHQAGPLTTNLPEPDAAEQVLFIAPVAPLHPEVEAPQTGAEPAYGKDAARVRFANAENIPALARRDGLTFVSGSQVDIGDQTVPTRMDSGSRSKPIPTTIDPGSLRVTDQSPEPPTRSGESVVIERQSLPSPRDHRQFHQVIRASAPVTERLQSGQMYPTDAVVPLVAIEEAQPRNRQPLPLAQAVQHVAHIQSPAITPQLTAQSPAQQMGEQFGQVINTPVQDAAWGKQISERVLMMATGQQRSAEIRLVPAELGPLRVQVSMDDGAANVTFHALHTVTRDAIEQALPRLREMLADNGLSLGQANVSDQGIAEGRRERDPETTSARGGADESGGEQAETETLVRQRVVTGNNLVDTFA